MTKIKICGLMTRADAEAVNQAQPDFAGVVFATGRHRVTIEQAELIRTTLNDQIPLVGVFTDQSIETILSLYQKKIIQIVQLHSPRERKDVERLKAEGVSLIQVAVGFDQIKKMVNNPQDVSDYRLVDAGSGSGQQLDWATLPDLTRNKTFLAGGLNVANLQKAIDQVQPYGVDLSSGSEQNGQKSLKRMQALVAIAHGNGEKND